MKREQIINIDNAKTSKCPRYDLIPREALDALAARFELGARKYGTDNWTGGGKQFMVDRLNHIIRHAKILIDKIEGRFDGNDDDAAAIACNATIVWELVRREKR